MSLLRLTRFRIPSFLRTGQNAGSTSGRNSQGRITVRHRGAGHSRALRSVHWSSSRVSSLLVGYAYDPRRRSRLARLLNPPRSGGVSHSVVLAAQGRERLTSIETSRPGSSLSTAEGRSLRPGERASLSRFEVGDFVHSLSLRPGQLPTVARSPGTYVQVRAREREGPQNQRRAVLRLPSGQRRTFSQKVEASAGAVARIAEFSEKPSQTSGFSPILESVFPAPTQLRGKAGRSRWLGRRPTVRGVARNPVDHPHGGNSRGRPSVTFKGWPTKGQPTRKGPRPL